MYKNLPKVIRIEPSGACNLKCIHCPTGTKELQRGIMSNETFEKIYDIVSKNISSVSVIVMYHGGEPLLNNNIYNWISRFKKLKSSLLIKIVSNGMLLDENACENLLSCEVDQIEISLDGLNFKQNDMIRRNCDGKKVVENVKALIKMKKSINSSVPQIYIANTLFANQNSGNVEYIEKSFEQELLKKEICSVKTTIAMQWPDYTPIGNISTLIKHEKRENEICDHVLNTITIRWNGEVVPCCYDLTSKFVLGNICEETIEEILIGKKRQDLINTFTTNSYVSLCENCNYTKSDKVYLVNNFTD